MRRPLIGAKDFKAFIGQGEQAQGRSWRFTKRGVLCVCGKERKKRRCEEEFLILMCGEVFMKNVCVRIKHERKLCVTSTCSKASRFLVQLVVHLKSTVGFVSK
jgi:hypothetical protein